MSKIYKYAILLRKPNSSHLQFLSIETPVCNIADFSELLQQQINKGLIPIDYDIVSINLSDILD